MSEQQMAKFMMPCTASTGACADLALSPVQAGNAEQQQQQQQRLAIFRPAFSKLVQIVRGHCCYPNNWRELDRSERADFKRARFHIGDTITDAAGGRLAHAL